MADEHVPGQMNVDECIEQAQKEQAENPWPKRKTAWQQQQDRKQADPAKPQSAKDVVKRRLKGQ